MECCVFDRLEQFAMGMLYTKIISVANFDASQEGSQVSQFSVPSGYTGLVYCVDADNSVNAEIDIYQEKQSLGGKYGLPIKTMAIPTGGVKLNIPLQSNKSIQIMARGVGADVTLKYIRVVVIFIKNDLLGV